MKLTAKIALAALSLGVAAPVYAQAVDVATMTCADFATLDTETGGAMLMWLDGYTGGVAEDTTLDFDRLKVNVDAATALCAEDPTMSVLAAMQAAVGQ